MSDPANHDLIEWQLSHDLSKSDKITGHKKRPFANQFVLFFVEYNNVEGYSRYFVDLLVRKPRSFRRQGQARLR